METKAFEKTEVIEDSEKNQVEVIYTYLSTVII